MSNYFSWARVIKYFPKVLEKFPITLNIVVVSTLIGLFLGILIAVVRIKKIPVLYTFSQIYISYIRGTPILVQLFVVYYGMPSLVKSLIGIDVTTPIDFAFPIISITPTIYASAVARNNDINMVSRPGSAILID